MVRGGSMIPVVCLDMALVAGVQLKMLSDISKIYGVPPDATGTILNPCRKDSMILYAFVC